MKKRRVGTAGWVFFSAGFLFVTFLALKSAPYLKEGFMPWINAIIGGAVFANPFSFSFSKSSLIAVIVIDGLYLLMVLYAVFSLRNRRPGEEYGSASWADAKRLGRKYEDRRMKVEIR